MNTIFGMIAAFVLVVVAIMLDGSILGYFNLKSVIIVVFGTLAVSAISFTPRDLLEVPSSIWQISSQRSSDPQDEAFKLLELATRMRKQDLLELDKYVGNYADTPFLEKALGLVVDAVAPEEMESILRHEANAISSKHQRSADILRRAGDVAPAMGLIGTLIGLVAMLGALKDPDTIGPNMSVALLTTLYGALMAHLIFIPLAAKTERTAAEETLLHNVYTIGAASIRRRENPRRLEMLLNTILPPAKRVSYFT